MDIESRAATEAEQAKQAEQFRQGSTTFAHWAAGYGVITHTDETQVRIHDLANRLDRAGAVAKMDSVFDLLAAADRVASAAMWLVVHMTYTKNVYLDGRDLTESDFKADPEGHTGGSLNMVPAYTGYLVANTLTGLTRSWLMGQGHCVSAIDATNLLVGNMTPEHAERYEVSNPGLTRFVRDFYSYAVTPQGTPESPLGSHVNAHTAGGMMEGGYLGFAELQYAHMPLPGERLVTFLSDGSFEEQRGSDWTPRWWRAEDCGLIAPFMIMNGRRIDQRSSMAMKGGSSWLSKHLELNGFTPLFIDGRDPASFAWGIIEMESGLNQAAEAIKKGDTDYPAPVYYGIAEAPKGYGFPGAGTNRAHNLPLQDNPAENAQACDEFNVAARKLWLDPDELDLAVQILNQHTVQKRPREKDHPLAHRQVPTPTFPEPPWRNPEAADSVSAMKGVAECFIGITKENPSLRVRLGNPDEIESNRLDAALELFEHRVTSPEKGVPEDTHGRVITALNEEAVINAVLANKGGINLLASYEAFMVKMLGAIRQELIFARHLCGAGRPPGWLSVPVIATSHTWENGKNEQSHQDTTFCEALLGEMTDVSRVLFPADWNSAIAALQATYSTHGQIWTLVIPKRPLPVFFSKQQAQQLAHDGAVRLRGAGSKTERLQLVATGGYQLAEVLKASERLDHAGVRHAVVYLQEPGRFRTPRDQRESAVMAPADVIADLFPRPAQARVFLTHTRPEPMIGAIWPLLTDAVQTPVLGYINQGGTLDEAGMLFANRSTWAHVLAASAAALGDEPEKFLRAEEYRAVIGETEPAVILHAQPGRIGGLE
ncbi:xylulose 5-phosphate 3-epimerase [Kineobactrum sediminis]|uniref:Xylulose 5-phosphate 3-epimerase n=1 Tax=Kineobactrum sediminis TaxID=1905677 RepID=A0A2N5XYZ9_9GAMM|nr:xylulose 5-phosphate 3-epimerase [Kineobactrum sediminis]PLW81352.1 xylulose 5-phosphate 3-epimerase [Kineobactrum sediminis]